VLRSSGLIITCLISCIFCIQRGHSQSLVNLAIGFEARSDAIVTYHKDTTFIKFLLSYDLLQPKDTASLGEMARFANNPWDTTRLDLFNLALIDSLWKYRTIEGAFARSLFKTQKAQRPWENDYYGLGYLENYAPSTSPGFSPIPNLTTNLIDGTARFIATRFKKELVITFFDDFRSRIIEDSLLRALLPQTSNLLIYQTSNSFLSPGEMVRSAFRSDIISLLPNFERFVRTSRQYDEFKDDIHFRAFLLALKTIDYAQKGYGISEILRVYYTQEQNYDDQLGVGVRLLDVLMEALAGDVTEDFAGMLRSLNTMTSTRQRTYFAAMAFQKDIELIKLLNINENGLSPYWDEMDQVLEEFLLLANKLRDQRISLGTQSQNGQLKYEAILDYAAYTFDVIDLAARFGYLKHPQKYQSSILFRSVIPLAKETIDIFQAIDKKDFGQVLLSSSEILGDMLYISGGDGKAGEIGYRIQEKLIRYGNFMINVMNAQTSREVESAIEAIALPPGSASVKRQTLQSISLNAYPGVYGGIEWLSEAGINRKPAGNVGFTAPIGLSFNWGLSKSLKQPPISYRVLIQSPDSLATYTARDSVLGYDRTYSKGRVTRRLSGSSFSIFVSIIDLGAAVSYRLSDDLTEGLPQNIALKQIISPGCFIVWGFPKMPVSLMGGVQYTPELRSVDATSINLEANTLRASLSLNVDLPIINLFIKQVY